LPRSPLVASLPWSCWKLPLQGFYPRHCGEGVCVEYIDIDSLRKLAVQLGIGQGWQAGQRVLGTRFLSQSPRSLDSFRIASAWIATQNLWSAVHAVNCRSLCSKMAIRRPRCSGLPCGQGFPRAPF
jgi:hypothetical protein